LLLRIISLYDYLNSKKEIEKKSSWITKTKRNKPIVNFATSNLTAILTKQLVRSGTSVGANIAEAFYAQSIDDFISKLSIALKEAGETAYWLELLYDNKLLSDVEYHSICVDCDELLKMLTSSINTSKKKHLI